jgi:hypothetical protein
MTRRPQKAKSRSLPSRKPRKTAKAVKRAKPVQRTKPAQRIRPAQRIKPVRRAKAAAAPLDAFIVSGASALGLAIDKAWMPAVRSHLEVTLRHGASVAAFALSDEAEPAPVFKA